MPRGLARSRCLPQLSFCGPTDFQFRLKGLAVLCGPLPLCAGRWCGDLFTWASSEAGASS